MAIATVNPSTGQLIKLFESLHGAEIEAKLQRAAETFRSYRKTPFGDRARWMLNAAAIFAAGKRRLRQQSDDHGDGQDVPLGRGRSGPSARGSASIMQKTQNTFWRTKWWKREQGEATPATSHSGQSWW
ncbi:MAG: aldehyde dehydrogenase family protein [Candidatus Acidiferrum sp.]